LSSAKLLLEQEQSKAISQEPVKNLLNPKGKPQPPPPPESETESEEEVIVVKESTKRKKLEK